jgi:hypothetical protein
MHILAALFLAVILGGCVARTAVDVVTLPVRAVGAGVDAVTTSQSEADEKRGREIRKEEERRAREERRREREARERGEEYPAEPYSGEPYRR